MNLLHAIIEADEAKHGKNDQPIIILDREPQISDERTCINHPDKVMTATRTATSARYKCEHCTYRFEFDEAARTLWGWEVYITDQISTVTV